ncbi:DHA2 family efflux MFS transporter permease subunit [Paramicrobacterium chengjingii]|uniref:DHA2 family efflux MFS transporter permease subunit n=1 Tax=Paramicrobacterium chengjingii TaxID=2769067 RepID=UPI0014216BA3|nr:DHA2 family efflux MFS transporter permease subunit [Microbacterium chengjingii]
MTKPSPAANAQLGSPTRELQTFKARKNFRLDPGLIKLALALMLASLAVGLDTTIVNVALDRVGRDFGASVSTLQWVSSAYLLALTMILPLTGWVTDRFGARTVFLVSLGTFMIGSMLCGIAWSMPALIAFRVIQGLGGGMLLPLVRLILAQAAGKERIGRAMVFVAVPGSLAPALGPLLGGVIVNSFDWRWVFYINAPLCLFGLVLAWRLIPSSTHDRLRTRFDLLGFLLLALGMAGLVEGLSEAGNHRGFGALAAWLPLTIGVTLLGVYAVHALNGRKEPIIDLRLFKVRAFSASASLLLFLGGSLFGAMFLLPLYFQQARGASVLQAGLLLAPLGGGMAISMTYTGRLIDRTGAERTIALIALTLSICGLAPYAFVGSSTNQVMLAAGLFVTGLGIGAIMMTAFTATYRGLTPEQIAPATVAARMLQQLGGVLGTVVLALILQNAATYHDASTAFGTAFTWALGLTLLAVIPVLSLPSRPSTNRK